MCPPDDPDDDDPAAPPGPAARAAKLRAATALTVRELVLFAGPNLPPLSTARVLRLGDAAVAPLLAILGDSQLRASSAPGGGHGPTHAATLLGELRAGRTVEPLLDVLATTAPPAALFLAVSNALLPFGAALLRPILDRLPTAVGFYRQELWVLLANAQVRDARIFDQLLAALTEQPEEGAMRLAEYGDPAALPHLTRALDTYHPSVLHDPSADRIVFELQEAIELLGGTLTPEQRCKYEQARLTLKVENTAKKPRQPPPHPDAPCPCRSGRQYKHCCLQ